MQSRVSFAARFPTHHCVLVHTIIYMTSYLLWLATHLTQAIGKTSIFMLDVHDNHCGKDTSKKTHHGKDNTTVDSKHHHKWKQSNAYDRRISRWTPSIITSEGNPMAPLHQLLRVGTHLPRCLALALAVLTCLMESREVAPPAVLAHRPLPPG